MVGCLLNCHQVLHESTYSSVNFLDVRQINESWIQTPFTDSMQNSLLSVVFTYYCSVLALIWGGDYHQNIIG
jgi:hypothetical protein